MKTLLLLLSVLIPFIYFSQPPNDACANATTLACGTTNLAGTTVASVSETAPSGCTISQFGVWYTFVGDGLPTVINLTTTSFDAKMMLMSGSCASKVYINCYDSQAASGTETTGTINTVNGTVYYIYVAYFTTGATTGAFTISRICSPANDLCANATTLACGTTNLAGTTLATASETAPGSCGTSQFGVWYTFVGDGNISVISSTSSGGFDHRIGVYSGTCASKTFISCVDAVGTNNTETTANIPTVSGTTYFVWISASSGTSTGNFTISRTCITPPANDACANATTLACGTTNLAGTTVNTVPETAPNACVSSQYGVWYTFVGDGNISVINTTGTGGFDQEMALFTGTCAAKTFVSCYDVASGNGTETTGNIATVNGTTYYLWVSYFSSGTTTGTFNISRTCIIPPANDACANATTLACGTSNLAGTTVNTVAEAVPNACISSQYGVWYTFVGDGNISVISTTGTGGLDQEMALFTGTCAARTFVSCYDVNGSNGTETTGNIATVNGTTYFVWVSYFSSGTTTGTFNISRTCITPPANDACANATDLPCGTTNLAGTTINTVAETAPPSCGSSQYGVWYKFTGNGTSNTISVQAASGFDTEIGIYTGSCGAFTNVTCQDAVGASNPESYTFTPTNGVTYYIYVAYYTSGTNTGNFTITRSCPTPPANDLCANATVLACGTSNLLGTTVNSSPETAPPTCGSSQYGVWYTFVGNGQQNTITVQGLSGFDTEMGIYTGSCGSFTNLTCQDAVGASNPETFSFAATAGVNYYIYVAYYSSSGDYTDVGTFNISRECIPPPPNDACANATNLPCGTVNLAGYTTGAVSETLPPSCTGFVSNYGVWYSFVGNGDNVNITVQAGSGFDTGVGIYSGTCASLNQLFCLDAIGASSPESQYFQTVNGTTYFVYVSYYNSSSTNTGSFTISSTCTPPGSCVTANTNDFCQYPAQLTAGPGTFSATTDGTFTADEEQIDSDLGTGIFCGSIENNSWYVFTASNTTELFPITSVTGCNIGGGIQGQVYQIGYNALGCCNSFTVKSNCFNPGTATTGTITATGLTPGTQYILMIDGYAGDGCEFSIANWSAIGILPVEFLTFSGEALDHGNALKWQTASESNNDYFEIMHSRDGQHFTVVGQVNGAGTTQSIQNYEFIHQGELEGLNYYKIEQVDFDGKRKATEVISIKREGNVEGLFALYPNPTSGKAYLNYFANEQQSVQYQIIDVYGHLVETSTWLINPGTNIMELNLEILNAGVYTISLTKGKEVNFIKIVKN